VYINLITFLGKRFAMMAISLIVIISISYTLLWYAPGNYLDVQRAYRSMSSQYNTNSEAYQQQKALFEERYGLNKPLYMQIWTYIRKGVTFNFGPSFQTPSVMIQDMVRERLPRVDVRRPRARPEGDPCDARDEPSAAIPSRVLRSLRVSSAADAKAAPHSRNNSALEAN